MKLNFFEQKKEEPKPETKEGFKPVSACIVDIKSVDDLAINRGIVDKENIDNLTREIIKSIEENGTKIDYY